MEAHRHTLRDFALEAGGVVPSMEIVYHTSAREYVKGDKVVWICHALTADSDVEDWWGRMVGPGCLIDTDRYFVVCVNMIGSPYGTFSPSSVNPETGKPWMRSFPFITIRDMAKANIAVREHLGIEEIDLLVGSSIGGFQALEIAVMEQERIRRAVFIATDARITPYMTALNESQRMALLSDPTFDAQQDLKGGEMGLRCARSIALISYRSDDGYNATQSENDEDCLLAQRACSYQQYQGKKLSDRFDAYCYWTLTKALDSHNLGRLRGGVDKALSTIKAQTLVVSVDSDCIFPPKAMKKIASAIPGSRYEMIHSDFGHDGFLLEFDRLTELIAPWVNF